jgi:hypothetical protein
MTITKPYKTIIVDDHPIVSEGLQVVFSQSKEVEIVRSFKTGAALLEYGGLAKVDIIFAGHFSAGCQRNRFVPENKKKLS